MVLQGQVKVQGMLYRFAVTQATRCRHERGQACVLGIKDGYRYGCKGCVCGKGAHDHLLHIASLCSTKRLALLIPTWVHPFLTSSVRSTWVGLWPLALSHLLISSCSILSFACSFGLMLEVEDSWPTVCWPSFLGL